MYQCPWLCGSGWFINLGNVQLKDTAMDEEQLKALLDSQDFYEVMYAYRIANPENQENVVNKFNDVKNWIIKNVKP